MRYFLLTFVLLLSVGCSSFMHGYTRASAENQVLRVDKAQDSFGYQRLTYMMGYHGPGITAFINEKGLPDYIFEFTEEGRDCAIFYYVSADQAFLFKEQNWRPDSFAFVGMRKLIDVEKQRFGITP